MRPLRARTCDLDRSCEKPDLCFVLTGGSCSAFFANALFAFSERTGGALVLPVFAALAGGDEDALEVALVPTCVSARMRCLASSFLASSRFSSASSSFSERSGAEISAGTTLDASVVALTALAAALWASIQTFSLLPCWPVLKARSALSGRPERRPLLFP